MGAGKTTLTKSMVRNVAVQGFCAKFCTPLVEVIEQHKPFDFCLNDPNGWETRTHGIDVNILVNDDDRKISIWDLAGQEEYHAFHDMMIPDLSSQGNPCFFLVVCNPFHMKSNGKKSLEEIQEEISYWLRFIASNTKRLSNFQSQVAIVMTHEDKAFGEIQHVENIVLILKDKFAKFINLSSKLHYVNAHSSPATKDVTNEVIKSCMGILDTLPDAFLVCSKMRLALGEWNKEHPNQPIVTMETFNNDIIDKKVPNLRLPIDHNQQGLQQEMHNIRNVVAKSLKEKARIAVAKSLHDAGEIIYFEDEDFVVVNPNWFCHKVMGRLIKLRKHVTTNNLTTTFKHGIGRREQIEHLLNISLKKTIQYDGNNSRDITKHLICLMLKMNLAYEIHPIRSDSERSSIFVPTTLQFDDGVANGARRLQWKTTFPQEAEIIYIGRRLQCCDQELTTLTPGFFPKLQV
jgi:GTPase SAR1 family protein